MTTHVEPITIIVKLNFETLMLKSSLCDHTDVYIAIKETVTVPNTGKAATPNNRNKKVVFKNCAPFTECISEIKNT